MNKLVAIGAVMLLTGGLAQAANITWGSVTDYSTASDVSTQGVLVEAINGCGTGLQVSPTVNGVLFVNTPSLLGNDTDTSFFFGDTGDSNYDLLLNSKDAGSESSIAVGGGQLEVGKEYLIQLWYLDERSGYDERAAIYGDSLGNVTAQLNDQYVIGTFTADGFSQTITLEGVGTGPQLTAYQLRDLSSAVPVISSTAGETVTGSFSVDIGFSESVTGLTVGDLVVVNGSASGLSGSGTSWSATITPTSNGDVTITLPSDTVSDIDGHGNVASQTWLVTYVAPGSEQPVPTLSTATANVTGNYTVQVNFSEPVTGLALGDFEISGGTLSGLTGSGANYFVVVSPNFGGDVVLSLPANSVTDTDDGLQNVASDELVTAYYVTVTVASPEALLPYLEQDNVTATLSPGTYAITAADIADGTFGDPRLVFAGSNSTYDFSGATINIAADVYTEGHGMNHMQILGNDNVLKNLTMVDLINKYVPARKSGGVSIVMDGRGNRIEGFHVTAKGSYPYGYGDSFGKGGSNNTIAHSKHSACLVRGESNHVKDCTFIHRSYGHCIFMQAASNPLIEGCYIEGEMRSTDDMLAEEGTGSAADNIDFLTTWGYRLPAGYMMSTGEGGIRAYNAGTTTIDGITYQRGTSNPTVIDCTVKHMRAGVTLAHATGTVLVENCTTIGCEQGYGVGSGSAVNCRADVSYGHAFKSTYDNDSWDMEIEIIPAVNSYYNGQKCIAFIGMDNSTLTLTGGDPNLPSDYRIQVGGTLDGVRFQEGSLDYQSTHDGNNNTIINHTAHPIVIASGSSGNTGETFGSVTDNGTNNDIVSVWIPDYGLTASTNTSQILLDWNTVTNASGYTVKRATTSGGPYTAIGTTNGITFVDTTALNGILYYYIVAAIIDGSETAPSGEVTALFGSPPAKFIIDSGDVSASAYQDPNVPSNTIDGNLGTRWSAQGDGQWIRYDLGAEVNVYSLEVAWLNGASRQSSFHIETSNDDANWTALTATLQSSGTTTNLEAVAVTPTLARYVRIVGHGNSANTWNSITEVEIWGTIPAPPSVPVIGSVEINSTGFGGQEFTLSVALSVLGQNYRVVAAENLTSPDWQVVSGTNSGDGGLLPISIPIIGTDTNRFYKLETWRQ
ncbi:Ig-like domain-containing protein [Pontiellaceae bacterium B12227]|nr:Ig-like domain-containing protein [Pontiellaceae bacterium B12227]